MPTTIGHIAQLYSYPIKFLKGQAETAVTLKTQRAFPNDRLWEFLQTINPTTDHATATHPPTYSYRALNDRRLLLLQPTFHAASGLLTLWHAEKKLIAANPNSILGRQKLCQTVSDFLQLNPNRSITLGFSQFAYQIPIDQAATNQPIEQDNQNPIIKIRGAYKKQEISIINLATIQALAQAQKNLNPELDPIFDSPLNPMRFRGNIYIDGIMPRQEEDWLGKEFHTQSGLVIKLVEKTERCAQTEINPATGKSDYPVLKTMIKSWRHLKLGLYGLVLQDGTLKIGDEFWLE